MDAMNDNPARIDFERALDVADVPATLPPRGALSPRAARIAAKAIELFNLHGASRISTNRVAAHLGLSPGNLHYHFRTNGDLFDALFGMMDADVREVMLRSPESFEELIVHQIDVQRALWRHRYFFRDLDYIVHVDRAIFTGFLELQRWAIDRLIALQDFYRENFNLQPVPPPNSALEISQNCWIMWISWVRWEAIANGAAPLDERRLNIVLHRLTWHHFSLHMPLIAPGTGFAIKRKLAEMLLE